MVEMVISTADKINAIANARAEGLEVYKKLTKIIDVLGASAWSKKFHDGKLDDSFWFTLNAGLKLKYKGELVFYAPTYENVLIFKKGDWLQQMETLYEHAVNTEFSRYAPLKRR